MHNIALGHTPSIPKHGRRSERYHEAVKSLRMAPIVTKPIRCITTSLLAELARPTDQPEVAVERDDD